MSSVKYFLNGLMFKLLSVILHFKSHTMKRSVLSFIASVLLIVSYSQEPKYDQHEAFNPIFYTQSPNEYRSASGEPGPKYWQNKADYKINCTLDTGLHRVTSEVEISYTNNSPDNLRFLWLQVDQNIYRD